MKGRFRTLVTRVYNNACNFKGVNTFSGVDVVVIFTHCAYKAHIERHASFPEAFVAFDELTHRHVVTLVTLDVGANDESEDDDGELEGGSVGMVTSVNDCKEFER